MLSLRERLASLGAAPARPPRPRPERRRPRGFESVATPLGVAWCLREVFGLGRLPGLVPALPFAYLDTETTGLAGGSGTYAFTAAIARPLAAGRGLEVFQVFLPEPAGEPAFLHLLQEEVRRSPALATYNGGRFDLPLLRTRWVMARMAGEFEHPDHLDLLNLTRSLLRQRLESCSLRNVEMHLLGFEREADLPGAMAPDAYFTYLRQGWSPTLEDALEHNRQDVLSLYYLHARLLLRLAGRDPHMEAADWLALGRHLLRAGRRADGWRALRNAADMAQAPASALAALLLARRLVRRGCHRGAELLLEGLAGSMPADRALALARARLLEWNLHDHLGALAVVEEWLEEEPAGLVRADLLRRHARLKGKLDRSVARRRQGGRRPQRQGSLLEQLP